MNEEGFKLIEVCLCCGGSDLQNVLDLGKQPLANSYLKFPSSQEEFPLGVNVCVNCWHLQLFGAVNPDNLFRNYIYISGTTKTLKKYFHDFVEKIEKQYFKTKNKLNVLEIASNDGSLLEVFKGKGHEVLGVDPAINLLQYSLSKKIITIPSYWDESLSMHLKKFDLIVAMNVFAHVSNPKEFLRNCQNVMGPDSLLILQTSQGEMVELNQFDTIYHEHISFFNVNSVLEIIKESDLELIHIEKEAIHGSSWVWYFKLNSSNFEKQASVNEYLQKQKKELKLFELQTYEHFRSNSVHVAEEVKEIIHKFKNAGYTIVGYGAAAKGNTFINFIKEKLDYIVDDSQLKWGLYSPGMNIPIKSPEFLKNDSREVLILVPAWNFIDEIKLNIENLNRAKRTTLLCYFPEIQLINL